MSAALSMGDDRRMRDRMAVDREAVLRMGDQVAAIMLEDLTAGGCRFLCDMQLPLAASVSIGIAGVGHTPAQIAWQNGTRYGCAFERPLPASALTPRAPDNVARIAGSIPMWQTAADNGQRQADVEVLPLRTRIVIIAGLSASLWSAIIGLGMLIF